MQQTTTQEYYDQGTEVQLLTKLLGLLDNKTVIDVGAERGSFVRALLDNGAEAVYAFEPYPASVDALRKAFGQTPSVRIFDMALGARDEMVQLHVVEDKTGHADDAYHSLVGFAETPTLRMVAEIPVQCRTLDALVAEGTVPPEVGILKIDTERGDFAVLQGMGRFSSAVVMIEYWDDLSETVGPAAYQLAEVASFMAERGYTNFVVIKRHDQFETLQLNHAETRPGDWGNAVFVHASVFPQLAPALFEAAALAQTRLIDNAVFFADEAQKRQVTLEDVEQTAEVRLAAAEDLQRAVEEMRNVAEERGQVLERVHRAADERQAMIEDLQCQLDREAGSDVRTRLEILEEQEQAIEAYLRVSRDDGPWKWVKPQLGVLYQHDPLPFHVPEHYLRTVPLTSPLSISIVTPTLNAARFLPATLQSVLDQEYPGLEYVIQDGGSTDETVSIVEQHLSRFAHTGSQPDTGMAQAINRGFSHTTGEIMAYLNADDLLLPGTLHFVAAYFASHPDIDVVYGHRVLIDTHNAEIGRWVMPRHDDAALSWADFIPQETLFWRRSIWERAGAQMDESFRFALDWDLLLRFREAGARFTRLPRFLGAFRVHADQKTSTELGDLGSKEMERLRTRQANRPVSGEEIWRYLNEYMRRHKIYHKLYRLGVLRY